jgi:asparagine synthase (glutamine-hydrolysing)
VALWREIADENLPGLLRYEDRNSMAFGIEARVPFLDHRVVELALTLPDRLRVQSRADRKIALVRAMHGIVPDAVLGRTDKVAFQPPQARWLRETTGHWRAETRDPRAEAEGFLAPGSIAAALTAFERGRGSATVLWRVLNLELWLRRSAGGRGS